MKVLLDTHLILWAAGFPEELPAEARRIIEEESNELFFSAASIWEIAIKSSLQKINFQIDVRVLRRNLLDNEYIELAIESAHAVFIQNLPAIHKDPFDRILVAQATHEGITLLTSDSIVAQYPGPILHV
ncbi:PIN domain [Legionella busanensis]|uniref:PIN domain n=1 Tax=Legionella busanensis TaxID=190655 RepID=A0A378JSW1_9GAMM|nr:type II toxin-antitoxin system VapC family toxin [Legionella busanensis]STX52860.1 PIN domain [Legionella busanensis]